jgi:hypothetical protein
VVKALRYATSRTVPGSIPGGLIGFFSDIYPSESTMVLGSTQRIKRPRPTGLRTGLTVVRIPGHTIIHSFSKTSRRALVCYKEVWRTRLNKKMDVGIPKKSGNFLTS